MMAPRRDVWVQNVSNFTKEVIQQAGAPPARIPHAQDLTSTQRCTFRPHYDQAIDADTKYLVLDFYSRDSDNRPTTVEGDLFKALIDASFEQNKTFVIEGKEGVGKTSLLRGLLRKPELKERFRGGVFFAELGRMATFDRLREVLSTMVEKAGGEVEASKIRCETEWRQVVQMVHSFFEGKQCLFMFDDVWEEGFISSDVVRDLISLPRPLARHNHKHDNNVILTTRSTDVAFRAGIHVSLEPLDVLGDRARHMLYKYSNLRPNEANVQEMTAVETILKKCRGLPQSIAIEGTLLRNLSNTQQGRGNLAYRLHAYSQRPI